MFNDNIIRTPINGTAAIVTSQSGCLDYETAQQEKDRILDRVNFLSSKINERKNGERRSEIHKAYGKERAALCLEISVLNKHLKRRGFGDENRVDHMDCVYSVMKEQLSDFQYKNIMKLAREKFINDEKQRSGE